MLFNLQEFREKREREAARRAIAEIAGCRGVTIEEVRTSILEAIAVASNTDDLAIKRRWSQIPCEGEIPTPEELIIWIGRNI